MPLLLEFDTSVNGVDQAAADFGSLVDPIKTAGETAEKAGGGGGIGGLVGKIGGLGASAISLVNPVGLAVNAVGFLGPKLLQAGQAADAENTEIAQLTNTVQNAIPGWDGNTQALDAAVAAGQRKAFADSDLRASLGQLATDTGSVEDAIRLQGLAMDLAAKAGIPLAAATNLVGKADDKNYAALAKLGIEIPKNATREEALALVHQKTAGAADIFANSTEGAAIRASASMDDALETIGGSVAPLIATAMTLLADVMTNLTPVIDLVASGLSTVLAPAVEFVSGFVGTIGEAVGNFTANLESGMNPIQAVAELLSGLLVGSLTDLAGAFGVPREAIDGLRSGIQDGLGSAASFVTGTVLPAIQGLGEWIGGQLPGLIQGGLGFFQSTIMPAFESLVGTVQTSVLPALQNLGEFLGANLPGAIATLSDFWTGTLQPAIQVVWGFIADTVIPLAGELVGWLITQIPGALSFLGDVWVNVLQPAITTVVGFITDNVIPTLTTVLMWLKDNLPPAIQGLANFWNTVLRPALENIWNFINTNVLPIFGQIGTWMQTTIPPIIQGLADMWNTTLKPALENVWKFIQDNVLPILGTLITEGLDKVKTAADFLAAFWNTTLQPALKTVADFVGTTLLPMLKSLISDGLDKVKAAADTLAGFWNNTLKPAIAGVGEAIKKVIDFINDLIDKISNVHLPDFMNPGSPTPWEIGLLGVADAMSQVSQNELPRLARQMEKLPKPELGGIGAGGNTLLNGGPGLLGGGSAPKVTLTIILQDDRTILRADKQSENLDLQVRLETRESV